MAPDRNDFLVSTEWLQDHLDTPDIVIVDGSWHLPGEGRDPAREYAEAHIPGAVFFDLDDISDDGNPLPHMLPQAAKMSSRMRKMGIGDGNRVVVYDTAGLFSAARIWWMLKVFGHEDTVILDGGLPKWQAENRPIEDVPPRPKQERHFTARLQNLMLADKYDVADAVATKSPQIADARSPARFAGSEPEPRPGVRPGHMPGAVNVHYSTLLNDDGTVKPADDIRDVFSQAGLSLSQPVITSCGSGVTAAILALGLSLIGHDDYALYDGSWAEWGADDSLPIER